MTQKRGLDMVDENGVNLDWLKLQEDEVQEKYEEGSGEYSVQILTEPEDTAVREQDPGLLTSMAVADYYIRMNYLADLDKREIVPIEEGAEQIPVADNVRLFHISSLSYDSKEDILGKMSGVFGAVSKFDATAVYILYHDGSQTDVYMGTSCGDMEELGHVFDTMQNSVKGNFPGCRIKTMRVRDNRQLFEKMFPGNESVACVSTMASVRGQGKEGYLQGLEKMVDAMRGTPFSLIVLASSVAQETLRRIRAGYENLYFQMSPFQKAAVSVSETETEGFTKTAGETITDSVTMTVGSSRGESRTTGTSRTLSSSKESDRDTRKKEIGVQLATMGGMSLLAGMTGGASAVLGSVTGGALLGNNMLRMTGIKPETVSSGNTEHTDTGVNEGTNESRADSRQKGRNTSSSENTGKSTGRTKQYTYENKTVTNILQAIDDRLERVKECEWNGAFDCAAYILAADSASVRMGAGIYSSLLRGGSKGAGVSYVNVWEEREEADKICRYISHMQHPVFSGQGSDVCLPSVTPAVMVLAQEMPIHFSWPRKSVRGLLVDTHAEFSRDVMRSSESGQIGISVGYLHHMGITEDKDISLDIDELTKHMFISGSTGSGKSNFCYVLLDGLMKNGIHMMVIEPAKGEYSSVFGGRDDVNVYGTNEWMGPVLAVNPFAFPEGVHVLEHLERLIEVFNASWPMYAAMPAVLKESVARAYEMCGWDLEMGECLFDPPRFPTFSDVTDILPQVLNQTEYSQEVKGNYVGALVTRVKSMGQYIYKKIFCGPQIPDELLFDSNVIIDISRLGSSETKSLIMGILIIRLQEYRSSKRKGMNQGLRHVTVLEEAHHLLRASSDEQSMEGANLRGMSVEILTNAIAEMRTYGEGFIIADQSPGIMDESVIRNTNTKVLFRLPQEKDRVKAGRAIALNDAQIMELARLETGVAAVHQGDWISPILCRMNYFPPERNQPFDAEKAKGIQRQKKRYPERKDTETVLEILLAKRTGNPLPEKEQCLEALTSVEKLDFPWADKTAECLRDCIGGKQPGIWQDFTCLCRQVYDFMEGDRYFSAGIFDPSRWNKQAALLLDQRGGGIMENTRAQVLGMILMKRAAGDKKAHELYYRWYSRYGKIKSKKKVEV